MEREESLKQIFIGVGEVTTSKKQRTFTLGLQLLLARYGRRPRVVLEGLGAGVSYLICHPAHGGEELSVITPDSAHQRDFERSFYGGAEGARILEEAGVKRIGMRPLRDLLRNQG